MAKINKILTVSFVFLLAISLSLSSTEFHLILQNICVMTRGKGYYKKLTGSDTILVLAWKMSRNLSGAVGKEKSQKELSWEKADSSDQFYENIECKEENWRDKIAELSKEHQKPCMSFETVWSVMDFRKELTRSQVCL